MFEFLADLPKYSFLQYALLTGLLASLASGIVGSYVVARRITYIADGIAHVVLGGIGVAIFLKKFYKIDGLIPLHGAIVAAFIAALLIGLVSLKAKQREDTVISALWAIGMAVGILFISKTPGYNEDLISYLFGNILMVSPSDLWLLAILDLLVIFFGVFFYHQFFAVCFDEEFTRIRGLNVEFYYLLLLCLTAITVVVLTTVVGVVMVVALITLPVAIVGLFCRTLWKTMVVSVLVSCFFTTFGLALSYAPDWPAGATIILLAGITYLIASSIDWAWKRGRS